MSSIDKYLVGYSPQVDAVPEKKDEAGVVLIEAEEEKAEVPGIEVSIKTPIPFEVLLKASEFVDGTLAGMIRTGEIVAKACAHNGIPPDVLEDGQLMMTLCIECSKYVDAQDIKKNS